VPETEDRELIDAVLAGDPGARAAFVAEYHGPLRRALGRLADDGCLLDDLAQDVFEALFADDCRKLRRWSGRSSLRAFLSTVAVNVGRDRLRGRAYRNFQPLDEDNPPPDAGHHRETDALTTVLGQELSRAVEDCLEHLPPQARELLMRRHIQGELPREIAAALGRTPGSVSVALSRAAAQMRDCMNDRYPGLFPPFHFMPHET